MCLCRVFCVGCSKAHSRATGFIDCIYNIRWLEWWCDDGDEGYDDEESDDEKSDDEDYNDEGDNDDTEYDVDENSDENIEAVLLLLLSMMIILSLTFLPSLHSYCLL